MRITTLSLFAATAILALAAPVVEMPPEETSFLNITIDDKQKLKHKSHHVADRDYNGECTQSKEFKRGHHLSAHNGQCMTFKADSDEYVRVFTYVPSDKMMKDHKKHGDEAKTCEVRAWASEDCSSEEIKEAHVPREKFWKESSTKPKKGWKVPDGGWHLTCINAPMVKSVRIDC